MENSHSVTPGYSGKKKIRPSVWYAKPNVSQNLPFCRNYPGLQREAVLLPSGLILYTET